MKIRVRVALILAAGATLISAGSATAAGPAVPSPTVTGPIATDATTYPFLATDVDLAEYGYVEQEYFIEGNAYRYDTSVPFTDTAPRIETGGDLNDGEYPFKTRIVVRRPADPADANGKVVTEWNNVTATQDIEFNWLGDPYYMLKHGFTFVGVTAQNTGVASLKTFDNDRYGDLTVNGNNTVPTNPGDDADALSFDVFSAAVKAIRGGGTGPDPMGGINVDTVIASGESQSCGRLASHYNKIEPTHEIVDAYLLTVCSSKLRTDRTEKAIRIITETENRTKRTEVEFPDTSALRHWEVAGASHLPRLAFDNLNPLLTRDGPFGPPVATCEKFPLSLVPWPYTLNRAIDALVKWVDNDQAPPIAPRGEYVPNPDFDPDLPPSPSNPEEILKRDADGIASGAIRYPEVTVPVGVNDGINSQAGPELFSLLCGLYGSSTQFPQEQLSSLYTDYSDYIIKYAAAADAMLGPGFILAEDVDRLKASSRQFAELRPSVPMLVGKSTNKGKFGLTWQGTEAPDTTFDLERTRSAGGTSWKAVTATIKGNTASLLNEPQGTHRYRVRSSTIIPATNISPARTTTTPYSEEVASIKVDRTGPKPPKAIVKGKKVRGKQGTYKGRVRIKFTGKPDQKLPDGSAGAGLSNKTIPKARTIKKKGKTVVKVRTSDKLGNKSKFTRIVIRIQK
ncbi:MAG: alpha/beta hydrolase domain-containing protein [Solirubrobacterales bacterium]